ncbi:MAG: hypothetical protein AAF787_02175 [Chloroflexota bacterium]
MGCVTSWDDDYRTIMRCTLTAPWSFDDIRATEPDVYAQIRSNQHYIGMIIHITEPFHLPTDALRNFQRQFITQPDEVAMTVFVVKTSPMVNMLFGIIERIGRRGNHIVVRTENMDEARHFIYNHLDRVNDRTRPGKTG